MADNGARGTSRVAIIGGGFAGVGMGYHLKRAGIESFVIFEKAGDIGGTWRENTYPGCACDIPSHLYSFSFERHYPWGWRYAKQSEILGYIRHCARKYGIAPHVRLNCGVDGADFDEARGVWVLQLADGTRHEAEVLVTAVGQLHRPAYPAIPGRERFGGHSFHSAQWDHDYALDGKTVAVIGTGASSVQFLPEIAPKLRRLHLFQRSPGWMIPKVEAAFSPLLRRLMAWMPWIEDLDRARIYGLTEVLSYAYRHPWLASVATVLARFHLWRQVRDPALRRKLTPDYPIGCKRILLSNDWYPALARPQTEVVTEAVVEINERGVKTADGVQRDVDAIIYGTGFAATQFLAPMRIRGRGGRDLHETWTQGAEAYLGLGVAGFPNLFMLYGPNTNLGSGSIIFMLERQAEYVTRMLELQAQQGWLWSEVRAEIQAAYNHEVQERGKHSAFLASCHSWYKTDDGRNTNNWIGSMSEYGRRLREPELAHYHCQPRLRAPAIAA